MRPPGTAALPERFRRSPLRELCELCVRKGPGAPRRQSGSGANWRVGDGRVPGKASPPSAAGRQQDETTTGQKVAPRSPKERGAGDCCPGVLMSFCRLAGLRGKSSPICGRSTTGRNDDRTKGRAPVAEGTRGRAKRAPTGAGAADAARGALAWPSALARSAIGNPPFQLAESKQIRH